MAVDRLKLEPTQILFCSLRYNYLTLQVIHVQLLHRRRNHGGSGGWCPPIFSDSYIARLNFIHTDHTALAYKSIELLFTKINHLPSIRLCTIASILLTGDIVMANSQDIRIQGIKHTQVESSCHYLLTNIKFCIQLLLSLSMFEPLSLVPLPQWRSAGVLHLMELTASLDTGSSMAMGRMYLCSR